MKDRTEDYYRVYGKH